MRRRKMGLELDSTREAYWIVRPREATGPCGSASWRETLPMNRDETAETIRRPRAFILSSAPQSLPTTPGMIQSSFPPAARGLKHGGHYKCGEETLIANTLLTTPERAGAGIVCGQQSRRCRPAGRRLAFPIHGAGASFHFEAERL